MRSLLSYFFKPTQVLKHMSFLSNLFNTGTPELFTVYDEKDRLIQELSSNYASVSSRFLDAVEQTAKAKRLVSIQDEVIDELIEELSLLSEQVEYLTGELYELVNELDESEEVQEEMADTMLQAAKSIIDCVTDAGYEVEFSFVED